MEPPKREIAILDCTLRDGGYPIRFRFTSEDAAVIAIHLERAGVRWIEIGHGLGLGASSDELGIAAATDAEYIETVANVLQHARCGVFAIPGIASLEDIESAARRGIGFIRIGTDVTRTEKAAPYIQCAKELGLEVSMNLMKTYAASSDEVVRISEDLAALNVDVISVVDSAGGMLPSDVHRYVSSLVAAELGVRIGFHGHNNLHLAVANTLEAIKAGAEIVDCTLCGLGRSLGNAPTEVVALILDRMGIPTGLDAFSLLDSAEKLISPISQRKEATSLEIALGFAQVHSGFLPIVERISEEYGIDPKRLVAQLGQIDKLSVDEKLARDIASTLGTTHIEHASPAWHGRHPYDEKIDFSKDVTWQVQAETVANELYTIASKSDRMSVFSISVPARPIAGDADFRYVRSSKGLVIGNVEVSKSKNAVDLAESAGRFVDVVAIDTTDGVLEAEVALVKTKRAKVVPYSDRGAYALAIEALTRQMWPDFSKRTIGVIGLNALGVEVAVRLARYNTNLALIDSDPSRISSVAAAIRTLFSPGCGGGVDVSSLKQLDGVIAIESDAEMASRVIINLVENGVFLDAGSGCITKKIRDQCSLKNIRIIRPDIRPGLFGDLEASLTAHNLIEDVFGQSNLDGIPIVAGGFVGLRGDIVVDCITAPTRVIGVADGRGGLMKEHDALPFSEAIACVKRGILGRRIR